jgi:hypothetical protein
MTLLKGNKVDYGIALDSWRYSNLSRSSIRSEENNNQKRVEVAQEWSRLFKVDISPEDINCDGCQSDEGRLFNYCKVCEIRKCGKEKGIMNCGYCDVYPCGKLNFIFSNAPDAKKQLDEIHSFLT